MANLVSNAIKYSPNGGEIVLAVHVDADVAVLEVRDQGIGIPADSLPHIFERFHRARNATGRVSGSGIGLASTRQLVKQHRPIAIFLRDPAPNAGELLGKQGAITLLHVEPEGFFGLVELGQMHAFDVKRTIEAVGHSGDG